MNEPTAIESPSPAMQAFAAYLGASEVARVAIGVIEAALKKGLHHSRPSLEQAVSLLRAQLTNISKGLNPDDTSSKAPSPTEDPYRELRAAHAAGKTIQYRCNSKFKGLPLEWEDMTLPPSACMEGYDFRVKPDDTNPNTQ